jgi:hypothetical protein
MPVIEPYGIKPRRSGTRYFSQATAFGRQLAPLAGMEVNIARKRRMPFALCARIAEHERTEIGSATIEIGEVDDDDLFLVMRLFLPATPRLPGP